ncbi:MAG TPA: hypothetical protein VG708_03815 [Mycobacteriales bacterium]|nr:hypothetical protein [Mycobacteriales bacterium]
MKAARGALAAKVAVVAVALVGSGLAAGVGPVANAAGTPPYEPDPQAVGTVTFFDASGHVITSGHVNSSPMAAYAVGSHTIRSGDTRAVLIAAQPKANQPTSSWNTDFLSGATSYPLGSGTPTAIQGLSQTNPVVTGAATDLSLADFIAEYSTANAGSGYSNLYQIRLKTADSTGAQTDNYDVADVEVTGNTFQVVYPGSGGGGGGQQALQVSKRPTLARTGKVKVGSKERVNHGSWSPKPTSYSYQWYAGSKKIRGATHATLKVPASATGKALSCRVTAHRSGFRAGAATAKGAKVVKK